MPEFENLKEIKEKINALLEKVSTPMTVTIILFIILFWVVYFLYMTIRKREYNCKLIGTYPIKNMIEISPEVLNTQLNKVCVKTAYNCCCTGDFKNDYVDTCALVNCSKQGVRALDFTIYSLHGEPVIAASTMTSRKYKEMYNSLPFSKTMSQVKQMFMYDTANCTNIKDPLFLIFRIQSANLNLYNKIADILQSVFGYSNADGDKIYKSKSIETELISALMGKVIICVDTTGVTGYENTTLSNITALVLGTMTSQIIRETEAYDMLESKIEINDPNINILYPDFTNKSTNYDFNTVGLKQQFQFIGMNFQMNDVYLDAYNNLFKTSIIKSIPRV